MIADLYKAFIFDLDGVVWLDKIPIPGAAESINKLKGLGKKIRFLSNNSSMSRETTASALKNIGIETSKDEVITSGYACGKFIFEANPKSKVFIIGSDDLEQEMKEIGLSVVERGADYVIVGLDRKFNYDKLNLAYQNLKIDKAIYIACNLERLFPVSGGFIPGTGSIVAALTSCINKEPDIVIGKPNALSFEITIKSLGLDAVSCLMIGDRIETDLLGARKVKMNTALVLSGVGKIEDQEKYNFMPEHTINSIQNLFI